MTDNHQHPDPIKDAREFASRPPDYRLAFHKELLKLQDGQADPAQPAAPVKLSTYADLDSILGPIQWDWTGWLPIGLLTILAGESGAGKSGLALRICGCHLCGLPWPDGSRFMGEIGAVLWCEAEAAQAINRDRMKAWNFPLDQIYTPLDNPLDDIKLDNLEHQAALTQKAFLPEVKLIVVDSLRGANSRDENSSETGEIVKWLAELARNANKPIILTHHLRKRSVFDSEGVELERLRGSSAIVQTARVVWALDVPDVNDRDHKRLQVVKSNLGKFPDHLGMCINDSGVHFDEAPEPPKVETIADKAVDLLLSLLAKEPVAASQLEEEFKQAGISWTSAVRAKKALGINPFRKNNVWWWSLPEPEPIEEHDN